MTSVESNIGPPALPPLPHGWEAKLDSSSGTYYYVDHVNGTSTWERPTPAYDAPPPRPRAPPPPPRPTNLPPGWESKVDAESGDTYYIDHMNRQSTWTLPTQIARHKSLTSSSSGSRNGRGVSRSSSGASVASTVRSKKTKGSPSTKSTAKSTTKSTKTNSSGASSSGDHPKTVHRESDDLSVSSGVSFGVSRQNSSSSRLSAPPMTHISSKRNGVDDQATSGSVSDLFSTAESAFGMSMKSKATRTKQIAVYPESAEDPVARDLEGWLMLEAPKQRELAPKGFYAIRKAVAKHHLDFQTAIENVDASNVSLNGHYLTLPQIRWWAVQAGVRFRNDTHYWYDQDAGFIGKLGGPLKWVTPPEVNVHGYLNPRSSLGETRIYINGREILEPERKKWASISMQLIRHTQYLVNKDGWVRRVGDPQPLYNWRDKERKAGSLKVGKNKAIVSKSLGRIPYDDLEKICGGILDEATMQTKSNSSTRITKAVSGLMVTEEEDNEEYLDEEDDESDEEIDVESEEEPDEEESYFDEEEEIEVDAFEPDCGGFDI